MFARLTAMGKSGYLLDLPVTGYHQAHELQLAVVNACHSGRLGHDVVMMLEHPPVFTMGRRGGQDNLLISPARLEEAGINIVKIERGGDITYHGPGQLVVYVLMRLKDRGIGVADFVALLETAMVRTVTHWDISARGDRTNRGAWTGRRKLGSVGITVRRGITFHGLALNVGTDLTPFQWINPCGLKGCEMTSLQQEAGRPVEMSAVRRQMAWHISELFEMGLTHIGLDGLLKRLEYGD
ncbi:MAG: lipoyl(octanoyl) transferase LipB [Desulfobacteraceae bacterium]